jgi:hypothetical protein
MTRDILSIALHHHLEFTEDLHLVVLEPRRSPPGPRPIRTPDYCPWGRSLGAAVAIVRTRDAVLDGRP